LLRYRAKASASARIVGGAGYAVVLPRIRGAFVMPLAQAEGMERRVALPFLRLPRPLLEDAGASRRSIAAFISARGRAFELA